MWAYGDRSIEVASISADINQNSVYGGEDAAVRSPEGPVREKTMETAEMFRLKAPRTHIRYPHSPISDLTHIVLTHVTHCRCRGVHVTRHSATASCPHCLLWHGSLLVRPIALRLFPRPDPNPFRRTRATAKHVTPPASEPSNTLTCIPAPWGM